MDDSWFMDDILGEPYHDPVMAEDGFVYERTFIERWFATGSRKSPKTLLPIGTSLFYPFEYYQMRTAWATSKGLPEPKKPDQYGRIGGTRPVPTPAPRRPAEVHPVSVNYDSDDEPEDDDWRHVRPTFSTSQDDFPPLPRASPPSHPPVVRAASPATLARHARRR
jgi:U-box domain